MGAAVGVKLGKAGTWVVSVAPLLPVGEDGVGRGGSVVCGVKPWGTTVHCDSRFSMAAIAAAGVPTAVDMVEEVSTLTASVVEMSEAGGVPA